MKNLIYFLLKCLFRLRYKLTVSGEIPKEGGVLIIANHISFIDWAMIQLATDRQIHFVIEKAIHDKWFIHWFVRFFTPIPINGAYSKGALLKINGLLKSGKAVCLFPEGGISYNGHLGKFHRGFEKAAERSKAQIVPCYIHGLWGSLFSRANKFYKKTTHNTIRRKVYVSFDRPLPDTANAATVKQKVFDASVAAWSAMARHEKSIAAAWLNQVKKHPGRLALADSAGNTLSNAKLFVAGSLLAGYIKQQDNSRNIGIMLPSSSAAAITNLAGLMAGKTVVNLNFTAGMEAIRSALAQAGIQQVYTSRKFIEKLQKRGFSPKALSAANLHYLEDIAILKNRFAGALRWLGTYILPKYILGKIFIKPVTVNQAAAILFSSGSEGKPKGIVLSQQNIQANARQIYHMLHRQKADAIMGSLPFFHAMGFTVTGIMPFILSVPVIYHPDPTDTFNIARAIAKYKISFYCGTASFLRMFIRNKKVKPTMLKTLRQVVVGAEKLDPAVRDQFYKKFGKQVFEGYGATETAPVASVNTNDVNDNRGKIIQQGNKPGTTGMPLPGTGIKVVDPITLDELSIGEAGLLIISGPQVMRGYLDDKDKTSRTLVNIGHRLWYKTGDKGMIDEDGFVSIVDRYSRFAKIGGEMVSLGAVENLIRDMLTDIEPAAVNIKHSKKGEAIVMFYVGDMEAEEVMTQIRQSKIPALMRPMRAISIDEIPKLGSGKTDYAKLKQLALIPCKNQIGALKIS